MVKRLEEVKKESLRRHVPAQDGRVLGDAQELL